MGKSNNLSITTNIKYMKRWFLFYRDSIQEDIIGPQAVDQLNDKKSPQVVDQIMMIPWGHNRILIEKCKTVDEALFYTQHIIENSLSRNVLIHEIESDLYTRKASSLNNYSTKLPDIQSDLAIQTLKDPYNFDFLNLTSKHDEKELEDALVNNMTNFLLELGQGFSYLGRQYKLEVGTKEFKIDLLFYHVKLHCYVVIELKTGEFKPEYTGKLNFYISAVDGELKSESDNPTIGILICRSKDDTVVEYALKNVKSPIGISEYNYTQILPEEFKSSLPSIEEIEDELGDIDEM